PAAHREAAVDRDRAHRGMREHETDRFEPELRGDRLEVVAVRAEAVQPDHARVGLRGAALDRLELKNRRLHIPSPSPPVRRRAYGGYCAFAHMMYYMRKFIQPLLPMPSAPTQQHERRRAIARLLEEHRISRQAELVALLRAEGFVATQSSVSRDLKELGAAKLKNGYSLPERMLDGNGELLESVAEFVRDIRTAGPNLLVVRTATGAAQRVAVTLDRIDWPEIVGTLS